MECTVPSLHNAIDEASNRALHFEEQLQQTKEQAQRSQLEAAAAHEAAMARMQQIERLASWDQRWVPLCPCSFPLVGLPVWVSAGCCVFPSCTLATAQRRLCFFLLDLH
eukprot:601144-Pelagomonas_calceolata.AAC.4